MPRNSPAKVDAECLVDAVDRLAVGVDEGGAAIDAHGAERDDEVGQLQLGDQHAVDQATDETDREAAQHADQDALRQQAGSDHAADANDRTDREVDALGHDDQGHADGDDGVDRRLQQNVEQIARLVERALENGEDDEQADAADRHAGLADPVHAQLPGCGGGCGVRVGEVWSVMKSPWRRRTPASSIALRSSPARCRRSGQVCHRA